MLVYIRGTSIWRPNNSVNIWNLLWLSRRLIISTKQTSICRSTFPNALISKMDQNHEISIYFSTNSIVALCHATSITLKFKMLARKPLVWCLVSFAAVFWDVTQCSTQSGVEHCVTSQKTAAKETMWCPVWSQNDQRRNKPIHRARVT